MDRVDIAECLQEVVPSYLNGRFSWPVLQHGFAELVVWVVRSSPATHGPCLVHVHLVFGGLLTVAASFSFPCHHHRVDGHREVIGQSGRCAGSPGQSAASRPATDFLLADWVARGLIEQKRRFNTGLIFITYS